MRRMWPAGRRGLLPPRGPRRGGVPGGFGLPPQLRRLRWQLPVLLLAMAALVAYDRTLDRSQDVFRPPELDVLGAWRWRSKLNAPQNRCQAQGARG